MSKIKVVQKIIYKLFSKVNKDIYCFSSFNGKYSDSPKYISEWIHKLNPNKKIYWLIDDFNNEDIPKYIIKVEKDSRMCLKLKYTAGVIIDNVYGDKENQLTSTGKLEKIIYKFKIWLNTKKGQKVYTTWHGTPLKKMGIDQIGSNIIDWDCKNTTMILGNEYTKKIMERLTFKKIPVKLLGSPRNDILFRKIDINLLKKNLNLPIDKKIVLFAPSFRTDTNNKQNIGRSGINQLNEIDFVRLFQSLANKFGGDWVFVCRFHYHIEQMVNWNELKSKYSNKVINGNMKEDMAEYLKCADILITDISSCIFDFSLTYKPAFIYFPDIEYYSNEERGLYMEIKDLPYTLSTTSEGLIKSIDKFDCDQYKKELKKFNNKLGYANVSAESAKIVAEFILEDENNAKENNN